jgi:AcrR family transcriptional regulator
VEFESAWDRSRARKRIALATAAVRLFREKGYEATTVEEIAKAAGTSASTFFRYFGTKEDVLFLNIREILDRFRAFVSQPMLGLSRWDQIHLGMLNAMGQIAEPGEDIKNVSIEHWLGERAVSSKLSECVRDMEQTIANVLAEARGVDPELDFKVQLAARSATAIYMSAFHLHKTTGAELTDLVDEAFNYLDKGIAEWLPEATMPARQTAHPEQNQRSRQSSATI